MKLTATYLPLLTHPLSIEGWSKIANFNNFRRKKQNQLFFWKLNTYRRTLWLYEWPGQERRVSENPAYRRPFNLSTCTDNSTQSGLVARYRGCKTKITSLVTKAYVESQFGIILQSLVLWIYVVFYYRISMEHNLLQLHRQNPMLKEITNTTIKNPG